MQLPHRLAVGVLYGLAMLAFLRLSESVESFGWAALIAVAAFSVAALLHKGFLGFMDRRASR
jgi:hypothetical protein